MDGKEKILKAISGNIRALSTYIETNEFEKAEMIIELLCFQIKHYQGHKVICMNNEGSLKSNSSAVLREIIKTNRIQKYLETGNDE